MAEPDDHQTGGAPPKHIHIEKKSPNWLAWIALLAGLLALLLALSRCDRDRSAVAVAPDATGTSDVVATTPNADRSAVLANTSGLGAYLAGSEPAPRTFVFDKLNFDTGKSDIRTEDANEVAEVASVLKNYPTSRIRIAGYADARGASDANDKLGQARADSVKAALVAKGIDAGRIDTGTGGESDPVANNSQAAGRFENRRTELVVIKR